MLTHGPLSHCYCVRLGSHSSHDNCHATEAALQQILLSCENLSLLDLPCVVLELKKYVATIEVIDNKLPEFSCRSNATDIVIPVQTIIRSLLRVPAMKVVVKKILKYLFASFLVLRPC